MSKTVYVSTPLKPTKFNLKYITEVLLKAGGLVPYIPPTTQTNEDGRGGALDELALENSDEVWAFGPLGRDCSWELGYAYKAGKPIKIFIDETNEYLVNGEDWMVPRGAEFVFKEAGQPGKKTTVKKLKMAE